MTDIMMQGKYSARIVELQEHFENEIEFETNGDDEALIVLGTTVIKVLKGISRDAGRDKALEMADRLFSRIKDVAFRD